MVRLQLSLIVGCETPTLNFFLSADSQDSNAIKDRIRNIVLDKLII
jgi:hypothetical protein